MITTQKICEKCGENFPFEPTEYNSDVVVCLPCDELFRKQEEFKELVYYTVRKVMGECPLIYQESQESRFPNSWNEIKTWKPSKTGKGLLLKGETGKCKTRMLWKLALNLANEGFYSIVLNETELADEVGDSFRAGKYAGYMKRLLNTKILIIDDLGKSKMTDRTVATIYRIVEDRTSNGLPILASTNLTGEELSEKMGDETGAIVRRLKEFCTPILC